MTDHLISSVVAIMTAIVGLAVLATLVSKQANTANVIAAGAKGFAQDLSAAEAPVTGSGGLGNFSGFTGGGSAGFPSLY